jgi:hypothetical protein
MKKLLFLLRIILILGVLVRTIFSIPFAIFYLCTKARNKCITIENQARLATREFMYLFFAMLLSFILFLIENPPSSHSVKMTIAGVISLLCIFIMLLLAKKMSPEQEKKNDKNELSTEQCNTNTMHEIFLSQKTKKHTGSYA